MQSNRQVDKFLAYNSLSIYISFLLHISPQILSNLQILSWVNIFTPQAVKPSGN